MCDYHEVSYWSQRYDIDSEPFEWYTSFAPLRPFVANMIYNSNASSQPSASVSDTPSAQHRMLSPSLMRYHSALVPSASETPTHSVSVAGPKPRARSSSVIDTIRSVSREAERKFQILEIGCGSSEVSVDIIRLCGHRVQVVAIDFAPSAIEEMRRKYSSIKGIIWEVMDVRKLDFPNDYFDLIIDKGCLDCFHCNGDTCQHSLALAVREIERVLKPHGTLLSVSHSSPDYRTTHFAVDPAVYKQHDRELRKREKEKRRSSRNNSVGNSPAVGNRRVSITGTAGASDTPKSRQGSRRGSLMSVSKPEPRYCLAGPVIHRINKQEKILDLTTDPHTHTRTDSDTDVGEESKTELQLIEESQRLNSANLGGWLDTTHFLYQVTKSRVYVSDDDGQPGLSLSTSNSPMVGTRRVSITVGQSSRAMAMSI